MSKVIIFSFHSFCIGVITGLLIFAIMINNSEKSIIENKAVFSSFNDTLCEANILYYLELYNVPHKEIVLKQCLLETGNFTSRLCIENNNLFGLKRFSTGEYFKFSHWSESIVMYKWTISYKYIDGCYYEFLDNLPYAEDCLYTQKLKQL